MSGYITPKPFNDLFFDFTGHAHANYPAGHRSIAEDLAKKLAHSSDSQKKGPLVIANSLGIYVYSGEKGHELISSAEYRAAPNSGFYEMTSLSHVGPAIAYLGALQKFNDPCWETHIDPMIEHLRAVKEVNSAPIEKHWLTQLACPVWAGKEVIIKNMFDYACSLAGNYLLGVRKKKHDFCPQHLINHFLEINSEHYPISFNTIMIATFALIGQKSLSDVYAALNHREIHWESAKILLHNLAGTNYGAGMTAGSNWLYQAVQLITCAKMDSKRIIIVPYAPLPEEVGSTSLSEDSFDFLANRVWGSIYARPIVTEAAFSHIQDIDIPYRPPIPGDYECTQASQIDHFIRRLKFSTGNTKEMLSNTVGFWLAGEAMAKKWQFQQMDIPGVTHGFPTGISTYPAHSPEIRNS
ncbi:hypothetical protein A8135_06400 [Legionella jamestowniensis]|uniref:DUF5624 domain-containing protein n=1 Tax=Legionella jamestowniensis TaxID=455 RepID=A0ABX2XQ98_9GAMM|nr:DUF5624 domain-containing protein [Legionella jamestowniensis]OCH96783.1 hypothetical protein A8135_06400 [Legionella jamestowniensis]